MPGTRRLDFQVIVSDHSALPALTSPPPLLALPALPPLSRPTLPALPNLLSPTFSIPSSSSPNAASSSANRRRSSLSPNILASPTSPTVTARRPSLSAAQEASLMRNLSPDESSPRTHSGRRRPSLGSEDLAAIVASSGSPAALDALITSKGRPQLSLSATSMLGAIARAYVSSPHHATPPHSPALEQLTSSFHSSPKVSSPIISPKQTILDATDGIPIGPSPPTSPAIPRNSPFKFDRQGSGSKLSPEGAFDSDRPTSSMLLVNFNFNASASSSPNLFSSPQNRLLSFLDAASVPTVSPVKKSGESPGSMTPTKLDAISEPHLVLTPKLLDTRAVDFKKTASMKSEDFPFERSSTTSSVSLPHPSVATTPNALSRPVSMLPPPVTHTLDSHWLRWLHANIPSTDFSAEQCFRAVLLTSAGQKSVSHAASLMSQLRTSCERSVPASQWPWLADAPAAGPTPLMSMTQSQLTFERLRTRLQCWSLSSKATQTHPSLSTAYVRTADLILLCYDASSAEAEAASLQSLERDELPSTLGPLKAKRPPPQVPMRSRHSRRRWRRWCQIGAPGYRPDGVQRLPKAASKSAALASDVEEESIDDHSSTIASVDDLGSSSDEASSSDDDADWQPNVVTSLERQSIADDWSTAVQASAIVPPARPKHKRNKFGSAGWNGSTETSVEAVSVLMDSVTLSSGQQSVDQRISDDEHSSDGDDDESDVPITEFRIRDNVDMKVNFDEHPRAWRPRTRIVLLVGLTSDFLSSPAPSAAALACAERITSSYCVPCTAVGSLQFEHASHEPVQLSAVHFEEVPPADAEPAPSVSLPPSLKSAHQFVESLMRFILLRRLRALLASAQLRHLDEDATLDALLEAGFRPEQSFWQSVVDPHFGLPPAATAGVVAAAIAAASTKSLPKALMGSCLSSTASSTAELRPNPPPTACCSIS